MPRYTRDQCPVCQKTGRWVLGPLDRTGAVIAPPENSAIVACRACGLVYVDPMPHWDADELGRLYGHDYFQPCNRFWEKQRADNNPRYRLRVIERSISTERRTALEIGAGVSAYMARLLVERGWQVDVQEPSRAFVERLRATDRRLTVLDQPFLTLPSTRKYALIYADSVLEHVPDPIAYFEKIAELLEPGGILYFVSPNEYSLENVVLTLRARLTGRGARMLCPYVGSHHLIGFTRRAVEFAGRRAGLDLVRFARQRDFEWYHVLRRGPRSPGRYAHALIAWVANAVGLGTNLEVVLRRARQA